ncbi:MAG: host specificity protein [Rhodovulum sulfidophilum]|uniref:Host specificity protein n=1 Tax=Rhodovulum sulfidophilum TaxID=35806 RepID=A0A2W5NDL6_RHOSU|nr:MAG: host specificity protein [Rhodovulum sulfidophilum]
MATLFLAAAGAAVGGGLGGSIAGLASGALGKAMGATLGSVIDQRLLGVGSDPVETGRVDRFRVMGASEGAVLPRVFGRVRVAGQMIWSSRFLETVNASNVGSKGGGGQVREYSYSVSFAVALCEGEILRVGRIWADGAVLDQSSVSWRLHLGTETQVADPKICAIEGHESAPAYRGTAYAVFDDLDLGSFGNRIPQLNFEVFRRPRIDAAITPRHPAERIRGVALVPGSGEYTLSTEVVRFDRGKGDVETLNVHNDLGVPDLLASTAQMTAELPALESVSLVVSWFGDDLRCGRCALRPAVEQKEEDATMPWQVGGEGRATARVVNWVDGRPLFGGTPADASVIQAIRHLRELGKAVMFYPFIMMDIVAGNGLPDPWSDAPDQPVVPWRGRITTSSAAGRPGSPDRTSAAASEVAAFFGEAQASDFSQDGSTVIYVGPDEWSYRRFILHYAHLCALAGGVDAFCVGSEMRGLTQIRSEGDAYPAVQALRALAADVRGILGPETKIGYAADWSEYFGHHPGDGSNDVLFHLDPLWADANIDFVGIDNYMPLSDWRSEEDHADAANGTIYDLGYLTGNVAGGEGFDWYYADQAARARQDRSAIRDGAWGEDWLFRYKDIRSWWSQPHHDRPGGVRASVATEWIPGSKPIWFTELGCPAVDKGTNQPNVFFDPKSSESFLPYHSSGARDDLIQQRYLQAMFTFWEDAGNNPEAALYPGRMVDLSRAHVWAWDARPWPDFPDRLETWSDGENYALGHWLNGRAAVLSVAEVVADLVGPASERLGLSGLHGALTGYSVDAVESARQSLQPLMLVHGFDGYAEAGDLVFASRDGRRATIIETERLVDDPAGTFISRTRAPLAETASRVGLSFIRADSDYQAGAVEAAIDGLGETAQSSTAVVLRESQARAVAERWLAESTIARDGIEFTLPPSALALSSGDVLRLDDGGEFYRVDKVEALGSRAIGGVRVERGVYESFRCADVGRSVRGPAIPLPIHVEFLDLPLLTGEEVPHAPYVAFVGGDFAGGAAIYSAPEDRGYRLNTTLKRRAVLGETLTALPRAEPGLWMPATLEIRLRRGVLQSRRASEVLGGANVAAVRFGDADWEILQFEKAELVDGIYRIGNLLRGQAGTDGVLPAVWPIGSDFILIDSAVAQLDLPLSARGLERHYRYGPASRAYDHASYRHSAETFNAAGLRPYAPAHLEARRREDGAIVLRWIRRTRLDGDSWQGADVPLGEGTEAYSVRILGGGQLLREFTVPSAAATYASEDQDLDGAEGAITFAVAQISEQFGPGPYTRITFNG